MSPYNTLRTLYTLQAVLGLIGALFGAFFVGIMATDAPGSSEHKAFFIGLGVFLFLTVFFSAVPTSAIAELKAYPKRKKLIYNYLSFIPLLLTFVPLALLQLAMLYRFTKDPRIPSPSHPTPSHPDRADETSERQPDWDAYVAKRLQELETFDRN